MALPKRAWRTITWREATGDKLSSRFARVRVRVAHRDYWLADSRPKEWLLIEWPDGENEPIKYWLSTLPEDVAFRQLVDIAKLRWRIERDYQELKQEVGLGHFEGRGWRGFHHHATLCIAAYGFLISERETIPPSGDRATTLYPQSALREGHQPRGFRRCGLNATFRTRLQRCDGDWWPLLPRHSHVAHAAPLGTDTKICDTVRLVGTRASAPSTSPSRAQFSIRLHIRNDQPIKHSSLEVLEHGGCPAIIPLSCRFPELLNMSGVSLETGGAAMRKQTVIWAVAALLVSYGVASAQKPPTLNQNLGAPTTQSTTPDTAPVVICLRSRHRTQPVRL